MICNFSDSSPVPGNKLGFGLWWIKTLLIRSGGSIAAESDGKIGTIFKIKLPHKSGKNDLESSV